MTALANVLYGNALPIGISPILSYANGLPLNAIGQVPYSTGAPVGFSNGLPFDAAGRLCVASGATPTDFCNGLPFDATGKLCIGSGAVVGYSGGVPLNSAGLVVTTNAAPVTPAGQIIVNDSPASSIDFQTPANTAKSVYAGTNRGLIVAGFGVLSALTRTVSNMLLGAANSDFDSTNGPASVSHPFVCGFTNAPPVGTNTLTIAWSTEDMNHRGWAGSFNCVGIHQTAPVRAEYECTIASDVAAALGPMAVTAGDLLVVSTVKGAGAGFDTSPPTGANGYTAFNSSSTSVGTGGAKRITAYYKQCTLNESLTMNWAWTGATSFAARAVVLKPA